MTDENWFSLANSLIAAAAGVGGVAVGAFMTAWEQRREARRAFVRQQLSEFYSPMLARRGQLIAALVVEGAAGGSGGEGAGGPLDRTAMAARWLYESAPARFDAAVYPLLVSLLDAFIANLWLAQSSTRKHLEAVALQVATIQSDQARGGPRRGGRVHLDHLYDFLADIDEQFVVLQTALRDSEYDGWRWPWIAR
ncbi:MAG TPA: hypothetical protein VGR62_20635 [Candidatus Binatia bacterium]|jgi:hypothetical protein|nr:hypothetical protein [Candidatus Binatia bacterium]